MCNVSVHWSTRVILLTILFFTMALSSTYPNSEMAIHQEMDDSLKSFILTPPTPETPQINGARVFGVRPGSPFLYSVPVTGKRPIKYTAKNLPRGLKLNKKTGYITGVLNKRGEYKVTLYAKNSLGKTKRDFKIIVGDKIALTPPMGWNSWNV